MMIKNASEGDFYFMRTVMGAIKNARNQHGSLESKNAFFITVGGKDVLVVNSPRFPSPACLSRTLVESVIPEGERPQELGTVAPAEFVVAMKPSFGGYDTVLFHELVHSQQIRRMWERRNIDISDMSDKQVMEGWRDRNLPIPRSSKVDEEYGSTHAEIHAFMMHTAYEFLNSGIAMLQRGETIADVESRIVSGMIQRIEQLLSFMRSHKATLVEDPRAIGFIDKQLSNYGVDPSLRAKKPRYRMSDSSWSDLSDRMKKRMVFLVKKNLRDFARATQ